MCVRPRRPRRLSHRPTVSDHQSNIWTSATCRITAGRLQNTETARGNTGRPHPTPPRPAPPHPNPTQPTHTPGQHQWLDKDPQARRSDIRSAHVPLGVGLRLELDQHGLRDFCRGIVPDDGTIGIPSLRRAIDVVARHLANVNLSSNQTPNP